MTYSHVITPEELKILKQASARIWSFYRNRSSRVKHLILHHRPDSLVYSIRDIEILEEEAEKIKELNDLFDARLIKLFRASMESTVEIPIIDVINPRLDKIALEAKVKCRCCDRPAEEDKGRVFFMGYWICNECEEKCSPYNDKCSITDHHRKL